MSTIKSPTIRGMDTLALIASRLRELRLRHGLTQQEFAELAGVGFKFYQLLESGRKKQIWLETVERDGTSRIYDAKGRSQGRISEKSNGDAVIYDAHGKIQGRIRK